jgi:hypothetical protein
MRILLCALALSLLSLSVLSAGRSIAQIGVEVTPGPGSVRERGDRDRDYDRSREDRSRKEFGRDDEYHGSANCKTVITRENGVTKKVKRCS